MTMKTEMTVNGASSSRQEKNATSTLPSSFPLAERNGSANTTIDTQTANCSPASSRHWRSAEQYGIYGWIIETINRRTMKRNTANYRTLIVTFCGVDLHIGQLFRRRGSVERHRAQRVDKRLYSTRFTQVGDHMAIITSEYNMTHVKKWLVRNILIKNCVQTWNDGGNIHQRFFSIFF